MQLESIEMDRLIEHPDNANVMSDEATAKLLNHIERTGCYEPLVVRPHPELAGRFQIINGHHRKAVLTKLGHRRADCLVWDVSDDETLMLLATLNRLRGRDDLRRRARLLKSLSERYAGHRLARGLPETRKQLDRLLELNRPPSPADPRSLGPMPEAMTFFVTSDQKRLIDRALRRVRSGIGGDCPAESSGEAAGAGGGRLGRGDLLACMADMILKRAEGNGDGQ